MFSSRFGDALSSGRWRICLLAAALALAMWPMCGRSAADDAGAASQPATAPSTAPVAPGAAQMGSAQVRIKDVYFDFVPLHKRHPQDPKNNPRVGMTDSKLIVIELEIRNSGKQDLHYKSFNGGGRKDAPVALLYFKGRLLAVPDFGDMEAEGTVDEATIKPGGSVSDLVMFIPPDAAGTPQAGADGSLPGQKLDLILPGPCVGQQHNASLVVQMPN